MRKTGWAARWREEPLRAGPQYVGCSAEQFEFGDVAFGTKQQCYNTSPIAKEAGIIAIDNKGIRSVCDRV